MLVAAIIGIGDVWASRVDMSFLLAKSHPRFQGLNQTVLTIKAFHVSARSNHLLPVLLAVVAVLVHSMST